MSAFLAAAVLTGKVFLDLQHARIKASIAVPYTTFLRLLRRTAQERVTDTDRFVALVSEVASPRVAADFLQLLKE